ncbi:MAG: DUF4112 domain-containing protein [Hyphomonadaceae bacterium]|nr:DUF4112 domain-containing protein [Hyphomonadaceae bacterium]
MARASKAQASERDRMLEGFRMLSGLLDNRFSIPFLPAPFGLDAILGLVPVLGDAITALMGLYALVVAHRHKLPLGKRVGMIWNIAIDFAIGSIPLLGDLFDWAFQAHRKNLRILERHLERQANQF